MSDDTTTGSVTTSEATTSDKNDLLTTEVTEALSVDAIARIPQILEDHQDQIQKRREEAYRGQVSQAERMVKRSRLDFKVGGDNVAVSIPAVDRANGDPLNIPGVILFADRWCKSGYCSVISRRLLHNLYVVLRDSLDATVVVYLQLVVQALVKNYEACKHLSPVEKNLKESDIEDVAVKLEYSIFTSTNVIMMYRKGMMSLMMGIRKDTTALKLRNELADHEPKLSLNQWAKQVEKELKNKNKVGSGFKSASQLMDDNAKDSSKLANKEPPNLSTRRGFSLKRSPNHQTSINSFFGKAPKQEGDSKKKDHQLSESESEGDNDNREGNPEPDKEEGEEDKEGEQGEDAKRSPQSHKERDLDSDCDSRYDPDENQEFGLEEVSLSDLEYDEEEDGSDVRKIADDRDKESEKKEKKDDMSYDFPESEGFTCDKGDEVSISGKEEIGGEDSDQDIDMQDMDSCDERKCADDVLKRPEDKDMLGSSVSGEKENVNSEDHGTTFWNSPLKDEDSYMEYSHSKNSDLHNKRNHSPSNRDTSRGQKRTMEEDRASEKTLTRKRTKLTEIDLFGNTDSQQSDSEPESGGRSSTKENRHQSEKDSKHKEGSSKSSSRKHTHKDDTSSSKGQSRKETSKVKKELKEIDLFGEADRDCESEEQQNERRIVDRKRDNRRTEEKSKRNEETHKKSSRSKESEDRHSKDERRSDKSQHTKTDDRRKAERDIKEPEMRNEKKQNFTFKSFKTDNRYDAGSRAKLPDETTYRKMNNFEEQINREKEKQEYNRKDHKPRYADEINFRKTSDSKERKQNENIERISSPRSDRKTSERRERRTSENKEARVSEGKERKPSEGKERRASEGRERRGSEGKERRGSEGKERRGSDGREKRTVESKERTPSETRERKDSSSSCQTSEPPEKATKRRTSADTHKMDSCLVEKSKPKPLPAPAPKNPPVNKKLIADWVVKHLMPHYKNESIKGKEVFKALARQLSHHISNQGVIREDDEVKQYVNGFFTRVTKVSSEADIVLE
ncbi:protein starmaker-like [Penaeus indicus]|uniref:protein starmaker-like n=1 Tax=Penaeus indicus TaxID=29960 RepID=UPI00300D2BAF